MLTFTSIKRSPPMSESEAKSLARETHLFGYEPQLLHLDGHWHLMVRGCGSDDRTVDQQLIKLRARP